MELLQAAGVPAGMVQRSSDLLGDPQLAHRRFFRRLEHTGDGRGALRGAPVPHPRLRQRAAAHRRRASASIPSQVLQDMLGFNDDDLARIAASGALV